MLAQVLADGAVEASSRCGGRDEKIWGRGKLLDMRYYKGAVSRALDGDETHLSR